MREHRCIRMNRRAKRKSAISNLKRRLPERQTHTSIAINKIWGQTPCMKQREKEAANMEQPRPDRQTHMIFPMTEETARIEERAIAMINIERQTPNLFQQTRRLPANQRLARSAKLPSAGKDVEIMVLNIERQLPDRQTHKIPNRLRRAGDKITYMLGVEPVAAPPTWVGGSTCVG